MARKKSDEKYRLYLIEKFFSKFNPMYKVYKTKRKCHFI